MDDNAKNIAVDSDSSDSECDHAVEAVSFINVHAHHAKFRASKDDTIIMHFSEIISHKLAAHEGKFNNECVTEAHAEFQV